MVSTLMEDHLGRLGTVGVKNKNKKKREVKTGKQTNNMKEKIDPALA